MKRAFDEDLDVGVPLLSWGGRLFCPQSFACCEICSNAFHVPIPAR